MSTVNTYYRLESYRTNRGKEKYRVIRNRTWRNLRGEMAGSDEELFKGNFSDCANFILLTKSDDVTIVREKYKE